MANVLRVAGKSPSNTAKGIAVTADGEVKIQATGRNVMLAESTADVTVAAGEGVDVISNISLADYPYHYIVVKMSATTYQVVEQYKTDGLSIPYPAIVMIDGTAVNSVRCVSDWIPCKGEAVTIAVRNTGESDITASVYLMGVR